MTVMIATKLKAVYFKTLGAKDSFLDFFFFCFIKDTIHKSFVRYKMSQFHPAKKKSLPFGKALFLGGRGGT